MDKKTKASALIGILALTFIGGIALSDEKVYYCEDRGFVMQCEKISAYYGLDNGKCWNEEMGNKLCRTGWIEIEDDLIMISRPQITTAKQYLCDAEGCKEK